MDLHLRGKRVLITGASKGIGAAAAEAFAEEGCDVMLAARNDEQLKALRYYPYDTYAEHWDDIASFWDKQVLRKG